MGPPINKEVEPPLPPYTSAPSADDLEPPPPPADQLAELPPSYEEATFMQTFQNFSSGFYPGEVAR